MSSDPLVPADNREQLQTRKLVYLALFVGSCALTRGASGLWRELDAVIAAVWLVAYLALGVRQFVGWWKRRA